MGVRFDHIEVHVSDISRYCSFLERLFEGGSSKVISTSGTSMFTAPDGMNIEVKIRRTDSTPVASGFCNPCLRRPYALEHITRMGLAVSRELTTPQGKVYFFTDQEGVTWHIKDLPE